MSFRMHVKRLCLASQNTGGKLQKPLRVSMQPQRCTSPDKCKRLREKVHQFKIYAKPKHATESCDLHAGSAEARVNSHRHPCRRPPGCLPLLSDNEGVEGDVSIGIERENGKIIKPEGPEQGSRCFVLVWI